MDVSYAQLKCIVSMNSGVITSNTWRRIRSEDLDVNKIRAIHMIPSLTYSQHTMYNRLGVERT